MAQVDTITNTGVGLLTGRLKGLGTEPLFMSWGTGAGAAARTDTTLFTEAASKATSGANKVRVTGTSSQQTTTVTNDTYRVTGIITSTGQTITNLGLFDTNGLASTTPTGGNLFYKCSLNAGLVLANNDTITFTVNVKM